MEYLYMKHSKTKNLILDYKKQLAQMIEFFISKPPSYWGQRPDEAYALYIDISDIEKKIKNNVQ